MTEYQRLLEDLVAEQQSLAEVVRGLSAEEWAAPTPAQGWAVRDQIYHLGMFDELSALAITNPEAFTGERTRILELGLADRPRRHQHAEQLAGPRLFDWWTEHNHSMVEGLRGVDGSTRIEWFGPQMSANSFGTARLMELWAHGQDVVDALGIRREHTDRVRHVVHLGVITRKWSFVNRKETPPQGEVRVELVSPSGETWFWGPADASDRIDGKAVDFALVVTQRANVVETELTVEGDVAQSWMAVAQCFAGPPTVRHASG
ncbi:TIGR03084 family metal-binding protein [Mycobacterium syngnathidarum]